MAQVTSAAAYAQRSGLTQPQLARLARDAINSGEVMIAEPTIRVRQGLLEWYLGGATCVLTVDFEAEESEMRRMQQVPLSLQMQVEVVRKFRDRPYLEFLISALGTVEAQIAEQLRIIQTSGLDYEAKMNKLDAISERVFAIYTATMDREARRRGLKGQALSAAPGPGLVELITEPPGGQIFLMHVVEQRLAEMEGRKATWDHVSDPSQVTAEGTYWYAIRRGGRTTVGRAPIRLKPEQTYTLR